MKTNFTQAKLQNDSEFKRDTGVSLNSFNKIVELIKTEIQVMHKKNSSLAKGLKPSIISA